MSLINQMLRDLEKRRKTEDRQLPSGEKPAVVESAPASRRLLYLLAGGGGLIALVWLGLHLFPAEKFNPKPIIRIVPADEQSQRIAIVRGQELFAALEEKQAQQSVSTETSIATELPAKNKLSNAQVAATVVEKPAASDSSATPPTASMAAVNSITVAEPDPLPVKKATQAVVMAKQMPAVEVTDEKPSRSPAGLVAKIKTRAAGGDFTSTLLNLGILESVGSARLMLEFEQLPEYRWEFSAKKKQQLLVQFRNTGVREALSIPPLKGPLLKRLSIQPEKGRLQLLIDVSKQVKVQALELPADPFHGHRLLVELYLQQPVGAVEPVAQVSSAAQVRSATQGEAAKSAAKNLSVTKTSKKEKSLSREEQAGQAYKAALEQLQHEDHQAAEANLSHALILNPRLLEARLQLVELLLNQQRNSEAGNQLRLGLQLHPDNPDLRKNYARQLLTSGQPDEALQVLQAEPRPEVSRDLEYHALLAALQQETGAHKAATKSYSQLLNFRPQEALWWMGLAISYEQSRDYARAKESYRRALSLPGLRPDLQDYIRNRLQLL